MDQTATLATIPSSLSSSLPPSYNDNDETSQQQPNHSSASNILDPTSSTRVSVTRAANAIGQLLPTASSISNLTARKYTLPDKTTASQVLMYRQLLQTECRPGLRLSRAFQGTPAQRAVMYMPWWEQGVEQTGKMIISYDNLITRLWLHGAIIPYSSSSKSKHYHLLDEIKSTTTDTLLDAKTGLPPIPHSYWTDRLGFQQFDPVTDFRSGGVLSLAMLVHIVEACPKVHRRFLSGGDAEMLPYGITSINVTNMLAKFLMFSKAIDKVEALMTSKPFWRAFADPNSLLILMEITMDMLCDVVVELRTERQCNDPEGKVTVFDFSTILETIEKRIRVDLLGAGPKCAQELRDIAEKLKVKYSLSLEKRIKKKKEKLEKGNNGNDGSFFQRWKHIPMSCASAEPTSEDDIGFALPANTSVTDFLDSGPTDRQ